MVPVGLVFGLGLTEETQYADGRVRVARLAALSWMSGPRVVVVLDVPLDHGCWHDVDIRSPYAAPDIADDDEVVLCLFQEVQKNSGPLYRPYRLPVRGRLDAQTGRAPGLFGDARDVERRISVFSPEGVEACVYRIFDSAWTQRTDGVSSRPDDGSVQADSRRTAFALQAESEAGSRNPDPTVTDQCASPTGTATTAPQQYRSFSVCLALTPRWL
jgi:hypothetical protein